MNADTDKLYQNIQAFSLDQPGTQYTFSNRLAHDNNWSADYSERVIEEYKKFTFLAVAAGHKVTPSDPVDQAWHQHLINSRSYWTTFCPDVLGQPLHHEPSQGGQAEHSKYKNGYQKTLDSYARLFGYLPPDDIWPSAELRFTRDLNFVRINTQHQWLIPKLGWRLSSQHWPSILPMLLVLITISGCAAVTPLLINSTVTLTVFNGFNFLGMEPKNFLGTYIGVGLILFFLANHLKTRWLNANGSTDLEHTSLSSELLAYLAGGRQRVMLMALTALIERGHVRISEDAKHIERLTDKGAQNSVEQLIMESLEDPLDTKNKDVILPLLNQIEENCLPLKEALVQQGFLVGKEQVNSIKFKIGLLFTPLLLLGLIRMFNGLTLGHPVGFLVFLLLLTGLIVNLAIRKGERTPSGENLLNKTQEETKKETTSLPLTYLVACLGLGILADTALADVEQALQNTGINAGDGGENNFGEGGCGGGGCGG